MTSHGRAVRFAVVLMLNAIAVPAKAQVFYGPPHIPARQ
ncbi:MAG: hypothetical protein RIQ68_325, partial [Pseudomonadota bacterium]